MNINTSLDPKTLIKTVITLEGLRDRYSENYSNTFMRGKKVLEIMLAISIKKHSYYFIECLEDFKRANSHLVSDLDKSGCIKEGFNFANSYSSNDLILMHFHTSNGGSNQVGLNAFDLAYSLSGDTMAFRVKKWLHGFAGGHGSEYCSDSGSACDLFWGLVVLAVTECRKALCSNELEIMENEFNFVIADLARNYGKTSIVA